MACLERYVVVEASRELNIQFNTKSEISTSILDGMWGKEDRQLLKKSKTMGLCDMPLDMLYIKTAKKRRKEKKTRPAATTYSRLPPAG